jgi:Flp pilus assembly protein TadD
MKCNRCMIGLALIFTVMICMAPLGCQSQPGYESNIPSNPIEDEFAAGKDRAPTPKTLYAMGRLLVARHRDAQAEYVFMRIIEEHPDFAPAYNDLAELQMRKDATADALATLNRGLLIEPDNAVLMNNAGICLMVSEDYEGALDHFTAASHAASRVERYHANRGVTMALMGEYDQAIDVLLGVLPHEDAHRNLGMICQANGDEARAADEFRFADEPHERHP